jgi:two-component system chemotaxis response regulator CheB
MSVRVVIVDDSEIAAKKLERALEQSSDLRVLGRFDGIEAALGSRHLKSADVVVLDLWMPGAPGLTAIRRLATAKVVIVVSEAAADSPLAREALAQGAAAFLSKRDLGDRKGEENLRTVVRKAAARSHRGEALPVVAIVGSTGAPRSLGALVPRLGTLSAAVVLVQHLPPDSAGRFPEWLTGLGLPTKYAEHGEPLVAGRGLLAPSGRHLVLEPPRSCRLAMPSAGDAHVPSGDVLLRSSTFLGRSLVAVVLSGMGSDGANGIRYVVAAGATCIVQAPDDCAVGSMPKAALAVSPSVRAVPMARLADEVARELAGR